MKSVASGMTLLELLLVIGLATAVLAAGSVSWSQLSIIFRLRSAGDEIRGLLQYGRELAKANKNQASYSLSFASGVMILSGSGVEVGRYQSPAGIIFSPAMFNWGFSPLSGQLTGCPLPCQLTLTGGDNSEVITIQSNGIID